MFVFLKLQDSNEDTRQIDNVLEEQKRQRELIVKRKEAARQRLAAQKRLGQKQYEGDLFVRSIKDFLLFHK